MEFHILNDQELSFQDIMKRHLSGESMIDKKEKKLYEEIKLRNEHIQALGSDFSINESCESTTAERSSMQYVSLQNVTSKPLTEENTNEVERTTLLACNFGIRRAVKSIDGSSSVSYSFHQPQSSRKGDSL